MLLLRSHHIVDLFAWVDDLLPQVPAGPGRPALLSDSELITVLIWSTLTGHAKTITNIHQNLRLNLWREFPSVPQYNAFLDHCHRVTPLLWQILSYLLDVSQPIRIVDSTMVEVCKLYRANTHKVAQGIAKFGKNHQGWHFGFKLHLSVSLTGTLCGISLTPANAFDAHQLINTLNHHTRVAVGDTTYGASVMGRIIWEAYGCAVIAPPHPTQKRKIIAPWQLQLLQLRPKIESVFDILKEHLQLVTSFPRSVHGYLLHYVRILLGYQVMALWSV